MPIPVLRCDAPRRGFRREVFRLGQVLFLLLAAWWAEPGARAALKPSVLVQIPGPTHPDDGEPHPESDTWAVVNEVVLCTRPGVVRQDVREGDWGGTIRWIVPRPGRAPAAAGPAPVLQRLAVVTLPAGSDLQTELTRLSQRPEVLYAEPNYWLHIVGDAASAQIAPPNDFEFGQQWGLHNTGQTGGQPGADIGALGAWSVTTGSSNILVAIIDTGMDYFHPDLSPNVWSNTREIPGNGKDDDWNGYIDDIHGFDFVTDDGDPMDDNLHGTHVAGILGAAGNDENGVVGVVWSVRMMALKAFDEAGGGSLDDTISAIAYAKAAGARIINASWGTTTRSRALDEVVAEAVRQGVVFVAAAGNNGSDVGFYPAAVPEVIAVSATDARDRSPSFANYGSFVDLVAPGDGIYSTSPNASWALLSGTSMAAPHVSGVVALLLSIRPTYTPEEIRAILRSTTHEVDSDRFTGAGRVDASRAVGISEPLPDASLDVPAVLSGTTDLRGIAGGHRFAGFRLELGAGKRPASWDLLHAGSVPVTSGILVSNLDTALYDDGEYSLRLSVSNTVGQEAIVRIGVLIRNVVLTDPLNNDVRRGGDVLSVRGTVAGAGRTFELSWGLGRDPTTWETAGLRPVQDGAGPVVNDVLARWDTALAPTNSFLTLRLVARRDGRIVGESFARMLHLESRLRTGWPRYLTFTNEFPLENWREFNVADLTGDGPQEIIYVDHGEPGGRAPRLTVLDPSGEEIWSRELPAGAPEHDAPVVGDFEGDGSLEIVVDTGTSGQIAAFRADGTPMGGEWPVAPGATHYGKIMADVDGDGRMEVIAISSPPPDLVSVQRRTLVVLSADGSVMRRWTLGGCDEGANVPEQLPAVANLDADDALEIVAVDGCQGVSAFDLEKPSGPIWTAITEALLVASPVVGDLDDDHHEEIVIGGVSRTRGSPGGVYLFEHNGERRPGWPILPEESFQSSAALADLDQDGWLEIIIPNWELNSIHVIRADGFELRGWPVRNEVNALTRSIPVVGDVDGDSLPDVVLASPGYWLHLVLTGDTTRAGGIRAWRFNASRIDFQPLTPPDGLVMESAAGTNWQRFPPAVLTDLDGDGQLDIIASTTQDRAYSRTAPLASDKRRSSLYAWSLPAGATPEALPWPAFQGGPARTGRHFRPRPPNVAPVIQRIPNQTAGLQQAFHPVVLDRYVEDPDGRVEELTWSVISSGELKVEISPERILSVSTPGPEWSGTETFTLRVRDAGGAEASAQVTFSVVPGYQSPVANADHAETAEELDVEIEPLLNDSSPRGRALRIAGVSRPGAGKTELLSNGRVRYTPAPDFFGEDTFEYTLADDQGGFAFAEVRVVVHGVNDAPVAMPDRLILDEDTSVVFEPLINDADVDRDVLALVTMRQPAQGRLETIAGDTFRFVPPTNYSGVQSFDYVVRDPSGLTSTGEVAILVKPVNDAPSVRDQTLTLNRNRTSDIIYDAQDADGDSLRFTIVDGPTNGVLLAYPTSSNYQPRRGFVGTDRFTYTVSDGIVTAGPATVSFEVRDVNNPPDVENVSTVTAEDQSITVGLSVRDSDEEAVSLRIELAPLHGEARLEGTNVIYTPEAGFVGEDRLTFRASDGKEESVAGEVRIRVTDENTAPVSLSEVLTVPRNRSSVIQLHATDAENNPLTFMVVTNPVHGRVEGSPPQLTYTPPTNFRGLDRLWFTARDRALTSEVAVVHLLVRDPNTIPTVTNQTVMAPRDQPTRIRLEARDGDGHLLQSAILKGPRSGRVYGSGVDYTYVPGSGFEGRDSFSYRVWDGFALSAEAIVTLVVEGPSASPPEFVGIEVTPNGIELAIQADPGLAMRIERSRDLRTWTVLGTVSSGPGATRWLDTTLDETPRFYRVVLASPALEP